MTDLTLKFGPETHKLVLDKQKSLADFKNSIYALTSVPVNKQTLVSSGKKIKTEEDLKALKNGQKILLIGSAKTLKQPVKRIKFVEDETKTDHLEGAAKGLINISNTCYMNSVLQLIFSITEIKDAVILYSKQSEKSDKANLLLVEMGKVFAKMENSPTVVKPKEFWIMLLNTFPQLRAQENNGVFKQQDAEECFGLIVNTIREELGKLAPSTFDGKMESITKCVTDESENTTKTETDFSLIKCHINAKTDHLFKGISDGLSENLIKRGENSTEDLSWIKTNKIDRLPDCLIVHFVRFYWKREIQRKAKIMKLVSFPVDSDLEMTSFCTEALKKKISEEKETGRYRLESLITHQGPYSESGHYVAWTKKDESNWFLYNDDSVEVVPVSEIKKLFGGGEWHSAYLAVFKKIKVDQ
ncbi:deubiquitinating enzyme [Bonamia ostreae]|uniref:ubiquitinyl hydrolase 1 n=1 Tax=Bonamia ostreae TaxID=126728 RepID=A0ABV2AIV7_9EUKA